MGIANEINGDFTSFVNEHGENCWFITQSGTYDATDYD